MLPQLSRRFDSLEARKAGFVGLLRQYSAAELEYRPAPNAWSALQIVDHLILSETGILESMIRSIPHGHPVRTRDRVKGRLLEILFLTPARVKVPARTVHILPKSTMPLEAHLASWEFVRRRMAETLDQVAPAALPCGAFQHPVSGRMDVPQTLRFLTAHIVHHTYQLRRNLGLAVRKAA